MFWTFKFSFNVDNLTFFGHFLPKIGGNFNQFSGHTVAVANGFSKYFLSAHEPIEKNGAYKVPL